MKLININSRGQITIPSSMRKELGLEPGSTLKFSVDRDKKSMKGSLLLFPNK